MDIFKMESLMDIVKFFTKTEIIIKETSLPAENQVTE